MPFRGRTGSRAAAHRTKEGTRSPIRGMFPFTFSFLSPFSISFHQHKHKTNHLTFPQTANPDEKKKKTRKRVEIPPYQNYGITRSKRNEMMVSTTTMNICRLMNWVGRVIEREGQREIGKRKNRGRKSLSMRRGHIGIVIGGAIVGLILGMLWTWGECQIDANGFGK